MHKRILFILVMIMMLSLACSCGAKEDEVLTLRVCNWEEYVDEGDWDEEETIDLESGDIIGENSAIEDFEEWYEEEYGEKI
nr:spermidine/putrescine ABC transporter substrate-binding protein [Lachnospiraceae bacterium]